MALKTMIQGKVGKQLSKFHQGDITVCELDGNFGKFFFGFISAFT